MREFQRLKRNKTTAINSADSLFEYENCYNIPLIEQLDLAYTQTHTHKSNTPQVEKHTWNCCWTGSEKFVINIAAYGMDEKSYRPIVELLRA